MSRTAARLLALSSFLLVISIRATADEPKPSCALPLPPAPFAISDVPPAPNSDLARLQGEWLAHSGQRGEIEVQLKLENHEARFTVKLPSGQLIRAKSRIVLDESTTPARLDWTRVTTLEGQPVPNVPGIYRLESDGAQLTLCTGGPLGKRPAEFRAGGGNPLATLVTFSRPERVAALVDVQPATVRE
jgi:uncharacterized protein (TIGR03067 family)